MSPYEKAHLVIQATQVITVGCIIVLFFLMRRR